MYDNFWVKIRKYGIFYKVEKYHLDDSRIIYRQDRLTVTKLGARMCARRFVIKNLAKQYIKEM